MKEKLLALQKKSVALVLGVALLSSAGMVAAPQKAEAAGLPTFDALNLIQNTFTAIKESALATKEYVLDTLSWQLAQLAIKSMTKSLVNWINSGFQGSPAFVTDLKQNLQGVGDRVASEFFRELSEQGSIAETPFQNKILDGVRLGYYLSTSPESFYTRYPYTLNQVSDDDKAFLKGDFGKGGWNAWASTVLNLQNNPYGAEMLVNQALTGTVEEATGKRVQELSWNKGFLSWRGDCTAYAGGNQTITSGLGATTDANGNLVPAKQTQTTVSLDGEDKCLEYAIKTPGSVIADQFNETLSLNGRQLVTADEFNEVIGALMNQLVGHLLGANNGGGLSGASRPSSGGGASLIDQATASNQAGTASIAGKFKESVNDHIKSLKDFTAGWQKIKTAAQAAQDKCPSAGSSFSSASPSDVLTQANAALVKGANALTAAESLATEIEAAGDAAGDQTSKYITLTEEYQKLPTLTPEEFAQALSESQDTGDADPGSLYSQMVNKCPTRGN